MNLQLIFSEHEMEDFLKRLGYQLKVENEIDGIVSTTEITPEDGFYTHVQQRKYAYKEGARGVHMESVFWQELKKKLLSL